MSNVLWQENIISPSTQENIVIICKSEMELNTKETCLLPHEKENVNEQVEFCIDTEDCQTLMNIRSNEKNEHYNKHLFRKRIDLLREVNEWIYSFYTEKYMRAETFFLAVELLKKYVKKMDENENLVNPYLFAMCCVIIACKLEEVEKFPKPSEMIKKYSVELGSFSIEDFMRAEICILNKFEWQLYKVTSSFCQLQRLFKLFNTSDNMMQQSISKAMKYSICNQFCTCTSTDMAIYCLLSVECTSCTQNDTLLQNIAGLMQTTTELLMSSVLSMTISI